MAPPRQHVTPADTRRMTGIGTRYDQAEKEAAKAIRQLDAVVRAMIGKGYNVSTVSRSIGVGRNVIYRSLERTDGG